jgi:hypothetical protein
MPAAPYDQTEPAGDAEATRERSLGEHIFIWTAWALAAAFWGATMTAFAGILRAITEPSSGVAGRADAGGVAWVLIDVVGGLLILGLALAYGSAIVARRNRRLDSVTEAGTAALYDRIERFGGEKPAQSGLK